MCIGAFGNSIRAQINARRPTAGQPVGQPPKHLIGRTGGRSLPLFNAIRSRMLAAQSQTIGGASSVTGG